MSTHKPRIARDRETPKAPPKPPVASSSTTPAVTEDKGKEPLEVPIEEGIGAEVPVVVQEPPTVEEMVIPPCVTSYLSMPHRWSKDGKLPSTLIQVNDLIIQSEVEYQTIVHLREACALNNRKFMEGYVGRITKATKTGSLFKK